MKRLAYVLCPIVALAFWAAACTQSHDADIDGMRAPTHKVPTVDARFTGGSGVISAGVHK